MAWQSEADQTIVISTRIRLARNFAAYPFPTKMDDAQASDVVYLVKVGLDSLDHDEFRKYDIRELSAEQAMLLQEQYLISPALLRSKGGAAFVSCDNTVSVMVNEEDHLREQYIVKGLALYKAYERICAIDDGLGNLFDFAFDEKLGYLTACPSNLGTGMRASVMMFLPGLVWSGALKKLLPKLRVNGLTVRGAFGEGTMAEGCVYQVSNERTLGVSEEEILKAVEHTAENMIEMEKEARAEMLQALGLELKDRCLRAYGTLTNCAILGMKEFHSKMVDIKLGVIFGFLTAESFQELDDFIEGLRPTVFRVNNDLREASELECDIVRAETVSRVLSRMVKVTIK